MTYKESYAHERVAQGSARARLLQHAAKTISTHHLSRSAAQKRCQNRCRHAGFPKRWSSRQAPVALPLPSSLGNNRDETWRPFPSAQGDRKGLGSSLLSWADVERIREAISDVRRQDKPTLLIQVKSQIWSFVSHSEVHVISLLSYVLGGVAWKVLPQGPWGPSFHPFGAASPGGLMLMTPKLWKQMVIAPGRL